MKSMTADCRVMHHARQLCQSAFSTEVIILMFERLRVTEQCCNKQLKCKQLMWEVWLIYLKGNCLL